MQTAVRNFKCYKILLYCLSNILCFDFRQMVFDNLIKICLFKRNQFWVDLVVKMRLVHLFDRFNQKDASFREDRPKHIPIDFTGFVKNHPTFAISQSMLSRMDYLVSSILIKIRMINSTIIITLKKYGAYSMLHRLCTSNDFQDTETPFSSYGKNDSTWTQNNLNRIELFYWEIFSMKFYVTCANENCKICSDNKK